MPQDAFTLKYICKELNEIFSGGKVNKIVQPDQDSVVLTIYTGKNTKKLYISANPSSPRIGILDSAKELPIACPNFCMLLRKHLSSATINGISLALFDRIVRIDFTCSQEFFDAKNKTLFVELMGRYSNVILVEEGKVLGANRGVNFFDNGARPLIANKPYVYPPKNQKREPSDSALISYFNDYNTSENVTLADYIFNGVTGLAISTATELERLFYERNGTEKTADFGEKFFDFTNDFIKNASVNPCIIKTGSKVKDVCVFDYKSISGEREFFGDLLTADATYFSRKEYDKNFTLKKERFNSLVTTQIKKIKKRLSSVLTRKKDAETAEKNKLFGELILSNIYKIKLGDESICAYNYYDNEMVEIPLNKELSPSQNSNAYYKKYNKQKRALEALSLQEKQATEEMEYLYSILDEINLVERLEDFSFIETELKNYGLVKQMQTKNKKLETSVGRTYVVKGYEVVVGRNNVENDEITFSAKKEDVWLHAKLFHSSHVIIKAHGKDFPTEDTLKISAEICAYYSKAREGGKTEIVYTLKKFVKKPPKAKPGSCVYTDFNSMIVEPKKHDNLLKNDL